MSTKLIASVVAGVCGTLFIGYCIYFDRKRRSDPLFKQKLRQRRVQQKKVKQEANATNIKSRVPDMSDQAAVQQFFFEEVQQGEDLLAQGDFVNSVKHLTNAIAVCGQPDQLLQVFRQTLPPQVFQMLVDNLNSMRTVVQEEFESFLELAVKGLKLDETRSEDN